jgi:ubiquinone/menaquinone biosynthesis C-methylase UbiE
MSSQDIKAQAQERFGEFAEGYITSQGHAKGAELERLVEIAQPQPDWLALDVATGGGHTALKFAPYVRQVIASDLTPRMLSKARDFITAQGATNILYSLAEAEKLPFQPNTFDLVTCRIAPHHFPDVYRFILDSARVLKSGGVLLTQDHVRPDDERDGEYVDAFERLRDPSHHRSFAGYEWEGMYLDCDLTVEHTEIIHKSMKLLPWAERQGCSPETILRLQILLKQAPLKVAAWMKAQCVGTDDAAFESQQIIILGRKP